VLKFLCLALGRLYEYIAHIIYMYIAHIIYINTDFKLPPLKNLHKKSFNQLFRPTKTWKQCAILQSKWQAQMTSAQNVLTQEQ